MEHTIWKSIPDYNKYDVSNTGHVRNKRTGKILSPRYDKDGYARAYLYDDELKGHEKKVHRLVGEAFLESENGKYDINHKNGDKTDNHVANLEWCTKSENTRHAYSMGLLVSDMKAAVAAHTKIHEADKVEILRMRNTGMLLREIADVYAVSINTISLICKGG